MNQEKGRILCSALIAGCLTAPKIPTPEQIMYEISRGVTAVTRNKDGSLVLPLAAVPLIINTTSALEQFYSIEDADLMWGAIKRIRDKIIDRTKRTGSARVVVMAMDQDEI